MPNNEPDERIQRLFDAMERLATPHIFNTDKTLPWMSNAEPINSMWRSPHYMTFTGHVYRSPFLLTTRLANEVRVYQSAAKEVTVLYGTRGRVEQIERVIRVKKSRIPDDAASIIASIRQHLRHPSLTT